MLLPDDSAVHAIDAALQIAEGWGDEWTQAMGKHTLGVPLAHRTPM